MSNVFFRVNEWETEYLSKFIDKGNTGSAGIITIHTGKHGFTEEEAKELMFKFENAEKMHDLLVEIIESGKLSVEMEIRVYRAIKVDKNTKSDMVFYDGTDYFKTQKVQ